MTISVEQCHSRSQIQVEDPLSQESTLKMSIVTGNSHFSFADLQACVLSQSCITTSTMSQIVGFLLFFGSGVQSPGKAGSNIRSVSAYPRPFGGAQFAKLRTGSLVVVAGREVAAAFKALDRLYPNRETSHLRMEKQSEQGPALLARSHMIPRVSG